VLAAGLARRSEQGKLAGAQVAGQRVQRGRGVAEPGGGLAQQSWLDPAISRLAMGPSALLRRRLARHPRRDDRWRDASFGEEQARALQGVTMSFTLDGAPLATTRTPIQPVLNPQAFGMERAWYFQEGRMSLTDLSFGRHELSARFTDPATGLDDRDGITFDIDAAGTGACLSD
jgi:hypothetical protein